jgi:hypothetical protein
VTNAKYWPFDVLPPEKRTPHHNEVIAFLEQAFHKGYKPYVFEGSNYGASNDGIRTGEMIHRGANRYWEIILGSREEVVPWFYVEGFFASSACVLHWLDGQGSALIQSEFRDRIVSAPGIHGW